MPRKSQKKVSRKRVSKKRSYRSKDRKYPDEPKEENLLDTFNKIMKEKNTPLKMDELSPLPSRNIPVSPMVRPRRLMTPTSPLTPFQMRDDVLLEEHLPSGNFPVSPIRKPRLNLSPKRSFRLKMDDIEPLPSGKMSVSPLRRPRYMSPFRDE